MPEPTMREHALHNVEDELRRAIAKFGPMASAHEGYAVVLEEVDEFWKAIKSDNDVDAPTRVIQMRAEATQIAAMAIRFIIDIVPYASTLEAPRSQGDAAGDETKCRLSLAIDARDEARAERDEARDLARRELAHADRTIATVAAERDEAREALRKILPRVSSESESARIITAALDTGAS